MNIKIERKKRIKKKGYYVVYFTDGGMVYFYGLYKKIANAEKAVIEALKEHYDIRISKYTDYNVYVKDNVYVRGEECDLEYIELED